MSNSLNPSADPYTYSGSMVFMGPITGVCFDFQFGRCQEPSHHEKPDGELQLHLCQACYQIRQLLVHHTCSGKHPGHGTERRVGAIGCPRQVSQPSPVSNQVASSPSPPKQVQQQQFPPQQIPQQIHPHQMQVVTNQRPCYSCDKPLDSCTCVKFSHEPDPMCPCESCARFVRCYQILLDNMREIGRTEDLDDFHSSHYEDDDDNSESGCECSYSTGGEECDDWDVASVNSSYASSVISTQPSYHKYSYPPYYNHHD